MKSLVVATATVCLAVVACTVNSTTTNTGSDTAACNADNNVPCPTGAAGYTCSGSQTPQATNASLDCGSGTNDGSDTDYCCVTLSGHTTCAQDSTVQGCQSGSYGFSCTGSDTPDQADSSLDCSTGTPGNSGETLYCCIAYVSSTCMQDSTVQGCQAGSYGFSCTGTDTPSDSDSSLNCSTGTAGNNGETLYCCTD